MGPSSSFFSEGTQVSLRSCAELPLSSRTFTEHLRRFEMHLMSSIHSASSDIRALTCYSDRRNQHVNNLHAPRKNFDEKIVGDWATGLALGADTRQLLTSFSQHNIPSFPRLLARRRLALESVHCQISSQAPATEVLDNTTFTIADIKEKLRFALTDCDRGIFGIQSSKKAEIEGLIERLEEANESREPTKNLEQLEGSWRLMYTTISILGSRRTKLGLREFVKLGDFVQTIDIQNRRASNSVEFGVTGLKYLKGALTIQASFQVASPTRVDIHFERSDIVPKELMSLFQKNYELLLGIFNPEGWLEITFIDSTLRVGRDDKGNIFLVEKIDPNMYKSTSI